MEWARAIRWHNCKGYAHHGPKGLYLARMVLGLQKGDGLQADHINRRPLDNWRSNLRVVTPSENTQNRYADNPYRGVSWHKKGRKWAARCKVGRKEHYLGLYADREEAARVAREARRRLLPYAPN